MPTSALPADFCLRTRADVGIGPYLRTRADVGIGPYLRTRADVGIGPYGFPAFWIL